MSVGYLAKLPFELISFLPPSLSTASLNALTLTCRRLHSIIQPELDARITPELGSELLLWAAASKSAVVGKLLSPPHSVDPNLGYRWLSKTPLHVATDAGNTATAALLLDAGADCAAAAQWGHEDCQPFHLAVCNKDYAMMELLLDRGAPLDDTFGADNVHENALHFACYDIRDPELVRFLLARGADTECRGHHGTALGFAMKARDVDVVKILLEHGAKAEVSVPLNGGWLAGGPPAPYKATLLYCALGLAHPRSRYSAGPASEGRRELMAMLLLHGASKEGAMKTVYEYLPKLAEAADKSEKELLKFVKRIFNDAKSAIPEVSRQFDRHRNPWYRLKDQVFRAKS